MCTAVAYENGDFYFGRTLDLECSYHEQVAVTPRNYPFHFRKAGDMQSHYAMIGMAYLRGGYPLYYEAVSEMGLSMAGLNFVGNAHYGEPEAGKDNVAPFEFIPWILGQCATLAQARALLKRVKLVSMDFSRELPAASLHWIISSREGSLTVESVRDGLKIYENPVGVLTNNPPFDFQMTNLVRYMGLSSQPPANRFCRKLDLRPYSRGMGALGLPGDTSSASRFVRAAFLKLNSRCGASEQENVEQFFRILQNVFQIRGSVRLEDGKFEITVYASCCNADRGIYYYTTYESSRITGVDMHREDLDGREVAAYDLFRGGEFPIQN